MQKRLCTLLTLLVALSACEAPSGSRSSGTKSRTVATRASATPKASASPTRALSYLRKPNGTVTTLKGRVSIDAHYVVESGRGQLIGQAGSNAIAAGGGNAIAAGGGNAVVMEGSPLIGQAGSNAIAAGGGNLIGQAGSNAIAAGGGNAIAAGGGNYRLASLFGLLSEETGGLAIGTVLPAAGMEIEAYSMVDGERLTLGVTDKNEPVYSIFTNPAGDYELFLPDGLDGTNVRVAAKAPQSQDERLVYNLVRPFDGEDKSLDEDTALVTAYLRDTFKSRIILCFDDPNEFKKDLYHPDGPFKGAIEVARLMAEPIIGRIEAAIKKGGVARLSATRRQHIAQMVCDAIVAYMVLGQAKLFSPTGEVMGEGAHQTLTILLRGMREDAAKRMREPNGRDFYNDLQFILDTNAKRQAAGLPPYIIKRPSDMGDYFRQEIFRNPDFTRITEMNKVLKQTGMEDAQVEKFGMGLYGCVIAIAETLVSKPKSVDAVEEILLNAQSLSQHLATSP